MPAAEAAAAAGSPEGEQLAQQAEKLVAKGRMAAIIAHEINNPLGAVVNYIYLARTHEDLPAEVAAYLECADRELERVAQIAQQTLGYYRENTKKKWIEVAGLVRDVMMVYEHKLRAKHIEIEIAVDSNLMLYAKQAEMKQVLGNLIANAIDAMSDGGRLLLHARPARNWASGAVGGVRISVMDNGCGMAPEVQQRILEPFYTTKMDVGTGIGLWLSKCIIDEHGGSIRFRSRQGEKAGTLMSVYLPQADREERLAA
jgi:signal transduction histidine kinase